MLAKHCEIFMITTMTCLPTHRTHVTKHNHAPIQLTSSHPHSLPLVYLLVHVSTYQTSTYLLYCTFSPAYQYTVILYLFPMKFCYLPTCLLPIIQSVYPVLAHYPPISQFIRPTASLSPCVSIYLLTQQHGKGRHAGAGRKATRHWGCRQALVIL